MTSYQRAFIETLHDQLCGMAGAICRGLRMILDEGMADPKQAKVTDLFYWIAGGCAPDADRAECAHIASRMMQEMCKPADKQWSTACDARAALVALASHVRQEEVDAAEEDDCGTVEFVIPIATRQSVSEAIDEPETGMEVDG